MTNTCHFFTRNAAGIACCIALFPLLVLAACGDDDGSNGKDVDAGVSACTSSDACGDGKVCLAGQCVDGRRVGLSVPSNARGCELAIDDVESGVVVDAQFAEGVKGSLVRRAPHSGMSFIASDDAAISGAQAGLLVAGDASPKITKSRCIDADGKAIKDADVTLAQ